MDPEDLPGQLETYESISVEKANELMTDDHYYVVDVRNGNEWEDGHIREAHHHMLGHLPEADLPQDKTSPSSKGRGRSAFSSWRKGANRSSQPSNTDRQVS